jgi:fucose permease
MLVVTLGGWITTFMLDIRNGTLFTSGLVATGFWCGLTLGRVTLGFVTPKIGERIAVSIYLLICVVLQLLFWLVPNFAVSAVMVALEGFFIGPLFPSTIVVATKLLPTRLHVSAIGFSAAVGGGGAAMCVFSFDVCVSFF